MNLLVRIRNPIFWIQIGLSIATPVLAYYGITAADITTWAGLGELIIKAISNPFVVLTICSSIWSTLNDPTTAGVTDSSQAMHYTEPRKG